MTGKLIKYILTIAIILYMVPFRAYCILHNNKGENMNCKRCHETGWYVTRGGRARNCVCDKGTKLRELFPLGGTHEHRRVKKASIRKLDGRCGLGDVRATKCTG